MCSKIFTQRQGVSIVELLSVIGIIGILLAISFPAFQVVRESARKATCLSNIRQVLTAIHAYEGTGGGLPAAVNDKGGSFYLSLLDHLDKPRLNDEARIGLQAGETYFDRLQYLSESRVEILLCPSHAPDAEQPTATFQGRYATHYYGVSGPVGFAVDPLTSTTYQYDEFSPTPVSGAISLEGVFAPDSNGKFGKLELKNVTDGTSHTIAIGENSGTPGQITTKIHRSGWAFGSEKAADTGLLEKTFVTKSLSKRINERGEPVNTQAFTSNHARGAQFGFVDGSVRFIDDRISVEILKTYTSIGGNEERGSLDDY